MTTAMSTATMTTTTITTTTTRGAVGLRWRAGAAVGVALSLLLIGWGLQLVDTGSMLLSGSAALALVLGMRHAFDADHVATIDDCSRLMVQRGQRPVALGLFFALGHSGVVLALSLLVALAAHSVAEQTISTWGASGGLVASAFAATFLLVVGLLNLRVLRSVWHAHRSDGLDDQRVADLMSQRGPVSRLLLGRLRGRTTSGWQLILVGMVFGLGLETASEVALLSLSATAAASSQVSLAGVLALPLLFAGGMALFDTLNSLFMVHMYSTTSDARRMLTFNVVTTAVTAVIALAVGAVYACDLLATHFGVGVVAPVGAISDHFEVIGYVIVAAYLSVWVWTMLSSRRARALMAAATPAAMSIPEV